ncbi:MAG: acyltransferase [Pseudomonadota bacterium]
MADQRDQGKLVEIQFLRGLAAATVALAHIAWAFADNIGGGFGFQLDTSQASQAAVMLFFVISGFIIVISSRGLFGRADGPKVFWTRRVVRVLPPYWIATALLLAVLTMLWSRQVDVTELAMSIALIPYFSDPENLRAMPFLWVGWTLFYEMVFYALFGLLIARSRRAAIGGAVVGLLALSVTGLLVAPENAIFWTATRPVLLLFIVGIALAIMRERGWLAPVWLRWAGLLASLVVFLLVPKPTNETAMGFDYLLWCGVPAILFAFSIIAGPIRLPTPQALNRAGDMSYALYLLHVPIAWAWLWFYPKLPFFKPGPWDFFFTASLVAFGLSWLFYKHVEEPMTRWLNARSGAART